MLNVVMLSVVTLLIRTQGDPGPYLIKIRILSISYPYVAGNLIKNLMLLEKLRTHAKLYILG
jgi:hypothetical protein